jgi:Tol biopolymer transport system component
MRATHEYLTTTLLGVVAIAGLGCGDPAGPTTGAIRVSVSTATLAIDRDLNGYTVVVDGGPAMAVVPNGTVFVPGVAAGKHVVQLDDLAPNCTVTSTNPASIEVGGSKDPASAAAVSFAVSCVANVGSVQVTVITSGEDPDPDGYMVQISGVKPTTLSRNTTQSIPGVRAGPTSMILEGVSGNCVITGGPERFVSVAFNAVTEVSFFVNCVTSGSILVTVETVGVDLDPDGYGFTLYQEGSIFVAGSLPANGSVSRNYLHPGDYVLSLSGISENCSAASLGPVTLKAGRETQLLIDIKCASLSNLAFVGLFNGNYEIFTAKTDGAELRQLTFKPGLDNNPAWSPDGTRIAFSTNRDGNVEIYVMNADGGNPVRLTTSPTAQDRSPAWSPDGTRIAFVSDVGGGTHIYVMNADGTNQVRLTNNAGPDYDPEWAPDGKRIAFTSNWEGTAGIWLVNADGTGATRLTSSSYGDAQPTWAPDGSRIAFSARPTPGTSAIFAVNADGSGRVRVTTDFVSATDPAWSPDGRKIAFTAQGECGWYEYYCDPRIMIIGTDGKEYSFQVGGVLSEPAWRR